MSSSDRELIVIRIDKKINKSKLLYSPENNYVIIKKNAI